MDQRIKRLWQRGLEYYQEGNLEAAQASFDGILAREPLHGPARYRLALIAARRGRLDQAAALCEQVLAREPNRVEVLVHLARCRFQQGDRAATLAALDRAEKLPKASAPMLDAMAVLATRLDQPERALALFERAVAVAPKEASLIFNRGLSYKVAGRTAAAIADFRTCLQLRPDHVKAQWSLSDLRHATLADNDVARLRARLAALPEGAAGEEYLAYALAKELDDLGEPAQAWPALERGLGARRRQQRYDAGTEKARVDRFIADADLVEPAPPADGMPIPIFVIGVPRSGVRLLAGLLARHPSIAAPPAHARLAEMLDRVDQTAPPAAQVRARYFDGLLAGEAARRPFVLDRHPMNFLHVPAIRRAFPEARLLHVERDPLDACHSQLARLFPEFGMAIASDEELAGAYRDYRRLMGQWHVRYPGAILDVSYESLVRKPEMVLRVVCSQLGLRFDRAMLAGETLHDRQVGRGTAYAPYLPHLAALRGTTRDAP
jgi:tetratricopeptide (TPR) repeat protein